MQSRPPSYSYGRSMKIKINDIKKFGLLIHFDSIRRECINEKLIMFYIVTFTFMRPESTLDTITESPGRTCTRAPGRAGPSFTQTEALRGSYLRGQLPTPP